MLAQMRLMMMKGERQEQALITHRNTPSTGEDFRAFIQLIMLI